MDLEFVNDDSEDFLCDRYRINNIESSENIVSLYNELITQYPDYSFLFTLDDINQACYTSMHSKMYNDLDQVEGYDLSGLKGSCFDDKHEHIGCLTTKEEFFIRKSNVLKGCEGMDFKDVCLRGISLFDESINDLISSNEDISSIIEDTSYVLKVHVKNSYETICAFPNGYFSGDLNPFENLIFAKYMQDEFGYRLIGIGASNIAFLRTMNLNDVKIEKLISALNKVYSNEFDAELIKLLKNYISTQDLLVLRYVE